MPIDPQLYKKYTGKNPGEAMTRYAGSLAQQSSRERGDTSIMGALARGRWFIRVGGSLLVPAGILYFLLTSRGGV